MNGNSATNEVFDVNFITTYFSFGSTSKDIDIDVEFSTSEGFHHVEFYTIYTLLLESVECRYRSLNLNSNANKNKV